MTIINYLYILNYIGKFYIKINSSHNTPQVNQFPYETMIQPRGPIIMGSLLLAAKHLLGQTAILKAGTTMTFTATNAFGSSTSVTFISLGNNIFSASTATRVFEFLIQ